VPSLVARTLLVPGYVEVEEETDIARLIAELDPGIPCSLLAFSPACLIADLAASQGDAPWPIHHGPTLVPRPSPRVDTHEALRTGGPRGRPLR